MPLFSTNIGIAAVSSGSQFTQSFDVINAFVPSPTYGMNSTSASVASIKINEIQYTDSGSSAELTFHLNSLENSGSVGDPVLTLFATGSNNEPRVGIGFSGSEKPIKAFDVKSKIDNSIGTEILLRSSRASEGAQAGDEAGLINFVIDSSSFNDITTTGSVATIKSIVDSVSPTNGVSGRLIFSIQRNVDTAVDMLEMGYGGGSFASFYRTFTSTSFEIVDISPTTTPADNASFTLSNGSNPYVIIRTDAPGTGGPGGLVQANNKFGTGTIFLHGPSGEITASLVSASGGITGSDVYINDWGSVSASLASAGGGGGSPGGSNTQVQFNNSGNFAGTSSFTWDGAHVDVDGDIRATGDVIARYSSDITLKDNIKPLKPDNTYYEISGVSFDWNEKQDRYQGHDIGFIAQEIEQVFPEAVDTRKDGTKAVDYYKLVAPLWEMVKDLNERIKLLEDGRS